MIDVSILVPEARETAKKVAHVYLEHTRPWFVGLLVHGSALKGGFIPGCSDIDFDLYLDGSAFGCDGHLPLMLAMDIHRDLSKIDPAPFQYIQCDASPVSDTNVGQANEIGPVPGTYHMLLGELPVPEATPEQVRGLAHRLLATLEVDRFMVIDHLIEHGGGRLERDVRLVCTQVWPALFNVLTLRADDLLAVWRLPKPAAIAMIAEDEVLGKEIRLFYENVRSYYSGEHPVEGALRVIEHGMNFLRATKEWHSRFDSTNTA